MRAARVMHQESRFRVFAFSDEKVAGVFGNCIASPVGIAFVAESDDEPIGFAMGEICPHPLFDSLMAFEYGIYVLPEHRGRMAGLRLVKAYVEAAKAFGVTDVNAGVTTDIDLDRTSRMYEIVGLHRVGTLFNTMG
ncbi:hypothetical protein WJ04_09160 [Burkholderia vietnamiensis]|nr:hypothetical protein WJ04_09160 [Burkholderia vietnamiensis]